MEQSITKLNDTDNYIINTLSLKDLQSFCSSSNYANNLCKNNKHIQDKLTYLNIKIDRINNLVEKNEIYLNVRYLRVYGRDIIKITNYIGIKIDDVYDIDDRRYQNIGHINIIKKYNNYYITLFFGEYYDLYESDESLFTEIVVTKDQLKKFLLHAYYDDIILDF